MTSSAHIYCVTGCASFITSLAVFTNIIFILPFWTDAIRFINSITFTYQTIIPIINTFLTFISTWRAYWRNIIFISVWWTFTFILYQHFAIPFTLSAITTSIIACLTYEITLYALYWNTIIIFSRRTGAKNIFSITIACYTIRGISNTRSALFITALNYNLFIKKIIKLLF